MSTLDTKTRCTPQDLLDATVTSAQDRHQPERPLEQRLLLHDVRWDAYVAIGSALQDRPVRMTFDRGRLEFMTTSPEHEIYKKWLVRCVETLAEEFGLVIATAGNMTFQRKDLDRGLGVLVRLSTLHCYTQFREAMRCESCEYSRKGP